MKRSAARPGMPGGEEDNVGRMGIRNMMRGNGRRQMARQQMERIRLYAAFARIAFLTQLEYRGQYAMRMAAKTLGWSTGLFSIMILLQRFSSIGGWGKYEILLLYAFDVLSYAIAGTFFMGAFQKLPRLIRQGELDGALTKPVNPMVYLICTRISAGYTSNYVIGIVMIVICFRKLGIGWSAGRGCWLAADIAGAVLIQAAGFVMTSVPAFWLLKCDGLYQLFFKNMTRFLQYPLSIYHRGVRILLTVVLPYAFINFYPVQYFVGRGENRAAVLQYMTPFVGAGVFALAYGFWKKGLAAYEGTGS